MSNFVDGSTLSLQEEWARGAVKHIESIDSAYRQPYYDILESQGVDPYRIRRELEREAAEFERERQRTLARNSESVIEHDAESDELSELAAF